MPGTYGPLGGAESRIAPSEAHAWELSAPACASEELRGRLLEESRRSSVARFWGAFLREFPESVRFCHASGVPGLPSRAGRVAWVRGAAGTSIATEVVDESPLGRYGLGTSFAGGAGGFRRLDTVAQFAQAFRDLGRFEPSQLDALLEDLEGSHANLFLGLCLREGWREEFAPAYRALVEGTGRAEEDLLARCEAWCALGHPFHPTPKSRGRMRLEEAAQVAPESGRSVEVGFVAVPRSAGSFLHADGLGPDVFLREAFPGGICQDLSQAVSAAGLDPEASLLVPIHPWQLGHLEPEDRAALRQLAPGVAARPQLSFRTVVAKGCTRQIKLPLQTCLTSALRQISPRSVRHAVEMSRILSGLCRQGELSPSFGFQRDEAFVFLSRRVGAIYRDALAPLVPEGCSAFPAAFLLEDSPDRPGRTVLEDLVERFGRERGLGTGESVRSFLRRYAEVAVPDLLRLLAVHGIGIEAHMQNAAMVFHRGEPVGIVVRDAEDLPLCMERFRRRHHGHGIQEGAWNAPEGPELARKVLIHALVHVHLGVLVRQGARLGGLEETVLWEDLRRVIEAAFAALERDGVAEAASDREAFLAPTVSIKCLLRMKLTDEVGNAFVYAPWPNPLHGPFAGVESCGAGG